MIPRLFFVLQVLLTFPAAVLASDNISGLHEALKNSGREHLELTIGSNSSQTVMPITVITGAQTGPTLLVLAGIHGSEYSPIIATQRLAPSIDPKTISGSVIFVHIANMPAYLGRTIYISPVDNKNLNRVFPGSSKGTLSEQIAHFVTSELYPLADAVLDMHSGDGNEQLIPSWTGYYAKAGSKKVIASSQAMAHAFGIQHIVEFQWELGTVRDAIWAGSAAIAMDIPSIDVEAGGMGIIDEPAIASIMLGVRRVMAHLGMTDETFKPLPEPVIIRERSSVKAPQNGSWTPLIDAGEQVVKNQLIGFLTDWHGRRIFEARAPIDGLLLLRLEAPPVNSGETLATIAHIL